MTFPEWTKPGIYGALGGAIPISILGFTWGGWTTNGSAQTMAQDMATEEVPLAMVSVCPDISAADPTHTEKPAFLQDRSGFGRRNAMMETGCATRPGSNAPDRDLADACSAGLELDGS
ncbi:hypothetical protein [Litoreibacter roseus]|uniref:Uncharacterized protein n=1 Tax=Litoreibacter roseus TaxID=2601869 RepID=A0A6N6JPA5_9RHOB|nr:hypothetical protein [Litoreibacter roseus]GFE67312.1 hypothetical protein KIN_43860 [Litoreibacter roseus]